MRFFEIVLLLVLTGLPFMWKSLARRVPLVLILGVLAALVVLQLVLEGYRWQLLPAYVLVLILTARILLTDAKQAFRFSVLAVLRGLGYGILLGVAWVLPAVLPVFDLPQPSGAYAVGTDTVLVQTARDEPITATPEDRRKFMVKIWYPAAPKAATTTPEAYVDDASRAGFATKYGLPASALNYLDHIQTYVYPEGSIAEGSFPVLLFSHGYGSKATGYYALLSALASQGYVVINMNHTYESLGAVFPNGEHAYFDYEYQQRIAKDAMQTITPIQEAFANGLTFEQRHPIVREAVQDYFEGAIQERWVADMQSVLKLLPRWNANGALKGHLQLDAVGVLGHSVGGGAAGRLALVDDRIKAGANLDGIQWGKKIDTVFQKPFLYVSADWPPEHEDLNAHIYHKKSTSVFYESKILGSGHPNFMDIPFMIPVPSLSGSGSIDPELGMEIITQLVAGFFDTHLKHRESVNLKALPERYEALELNVYEGMEE